MKPLPTRTSPRRSDYDYTSSGVYFITICTAGRQHYFGDVKDGEMRLNELGIFVTEHRNQISDHYPFVETGEFVCMPNHIHGIIVICNRTGNCDVGMQFLASDMKTPNMSDTQNQNISDMKNKVHDVGTQFLASDIGGTDDNRIHNDDHDRTYGLDEKRTYKNTSLQPPPSGSLGAIVRGYKIGITKYAKQLNIEFKRQGRYHDHIIRNEKEYNTIKYYIQTNPQKRGEDKFYDG